MEANMSFESPALPFTSSNPNIQSKISVSICNDHETISSTSGDPTCEQKNLSTDIADSFITIGAGEKPASSTKICMHSNKLTLSFEEKLKLEVRICC